MKVVAEMLMELRKRTVAKVMLSMSFTDNLSFLIEFTSLNLAYIKKYIYLNIYNLFI